MPFVLDNSVACGWVFEDQASDYTQAVAHRLRTDDALAPALWELEFANVLRTACVRQRIDAQWAHALAARVARLPIEVDARGARPSELLGLSLRFGLTAYDAAYLELALRRGVPVATCDARLRDAAMASGAGWVS